jgi:putative Ca2+/H+ antiporter (TMEM165/GDT1 family)
MTNQARGRLLGPRPRLVRSGKRSVFMTVLTAQRYRSKRRTFGLYLIRRLAMTVLVVVVDEVVVVLLAAYTDVVRGSNVDDVDAPS